MALKHSYRNTVIRPNLTLDESGIEINEEYRSRNSTMMNYSSPPVYHLSQLDTTPQPPANMYNYPYHSSNIQNSSGNVVGYSQTPRLSTSANTQYQQQNGVTNNNDYKDQNITCYRCNTKGHYAIRVNLIKNS